MLVVEKEPCFGARLHGRAAGFGFRAPASPPSRALKSPGRDQSLSQARDHDAL